MIPRAHHLTGPGTRAARGGLVLGSRRVAGLLVQEDQGKALTDWWVLGRWLPCPSDRKDAAEGRRASIPRDSPAQIPPPLRHPPSTTTKQLAGQPGERRSTFLPRRDRPPPSANGKRDRLLFPPPAAGSSLLIVAVVCARYLSVLLIINLRDLDLCRVGVREELARFDLRCSCSFTSYSSGTLSVLSSQWQDVSPTCV